MDGKRGWLVSAALTRGMMVGQRRSARPIFRVAAAGALWGVFVAVSGCSQQTRLPSILPSPGDADKRSFNVHDPLPESDIGPDTGARPRGFEYERSEPRRSEEARGQLGILPNGGGQMGPPGGVMGPPGPPVAPGMPIAPGAPIAPGTPIAPGGTMVPPGQPFQ